MKTRKIFAALLCAAAMALLCAGCSAQAEPPAASGLPPQSQPSAAPENTAGRLGQLKSFTAGTLEGGLFTQDDIAAKDVTVINFWALSCRSCIAEMPDLASFGRALPGNVGLITVCLDGGGNEELVQMVLEQAGYEGVTLISGDGDLLALSGNLIYTPTTLLADGEGNLVGKPIVGGQKDLHGTLLDAVNGALRAGGKAEISLER